LTGRFSALYNCIWVNPVHGHVGAAIIEHILDVSICPLHVSFDIHSKSWGLWDGESEIEGDSAWNAAQADENTPTVVHMLRLVEVVRDDGIFVREDGQ
jgi:hypothetical protein